MISPDITISNHRLRWAVDGMRFTAPLHIWQENCWPKHKTNRRKFYICADGPHTHTRPKPGQPWKARGRKKADTNDGQTARTAQGGEGNRQTSGTNLHGETDLTKTEHTPKPHNTLRRSREGRVIREGPNGGLVGDENEKPKQDSVPTPTGRALLPFGNVVQSCPKVLNGCTSSNELGAQNV